MHLKMLSASWQPFSVGLNMLTHIHIADGEFMESSSLSH